MTLGRGLFAALTLLGALSAGCEQDKIKTVPERQGDRGESCLVTNDCKSGLLCAAGRCVKDDIAIEPTAKTCVSVECIDNTDCCPPLSKDQQKSCDSLQSSCSEGSTSACRSFDLSCKCQETCTDHVCVGMAVQGESCIDSTDCFGTRSVCASGTCVECAASTDCDTGEQCLNGRCTECAADADCGTGFICESNQCRRGCTRDEACGAMAACNAGRCEKRGCKDDRECVAFLGARDAVCVMATGECSIPCVNDAGCAGLNDGLFACKEGSCVYVGCASNAECAALVDDSPGGGSFPICVDKAEADKIKAVLIDN